LERGTLPDHRRRYHRILIRTSRQLGESHPGLPQGGPERSIDHRTPQQGVLR
jgi:hypothetical protein